MPFSPRKSLILVLFALLAGGVLAQQAEDPATTTEPTAETATASAAPEQPQANVLDDPNAGYHLREQFTTILRQHPDQVAAVLADDPTLLTNEAYVARYPDIAEFLKTHPQVLRNPAFYMEHVEVPGRRANTIDRLVEPVIMISVFGIVAFTLTWLVRTVIEQKRWSRLSRTQTEVHNKILDRFGSSDELLAYIKSPAGSKFLESAPIAVRTEQPVQNAPVSRMLWSIQAGLVIAAGSIGLLIVSMNVGKESVEDLFILGTIGLCIGAGFVLSAIVSMVLSRRLGLWHQRAPEPAEDAGLVR